MSWRLTVDARASPLLSTDPAKKSSGAPKSSYDGGRRGGLLVFGSRAGGCHDEAAGIFEASDTIVQGPRSLALRATAAMTRLSGALLWCLPRLASEAVV